MQLQPKQTPKTYHHKKGINQSEMKFNKMQLQTKNVLLNDDLRECIERITLKMSNSKMQTFHPPFFQKTLTKYRQQSYSNKLQKIISEKQKDKASFGQGQGLKLLKQFIENFDQEYLDNYIEQIRQPYIRKIFNQSYEIDKVNFKKINSEYELRKQIENVLNETSEWLIQIQVLQDVLNRIELYFGIPYSTISQKLKSQSAENRKGSWGESFTSLLRKVSSYALRKSSKLVQNSSYAAMLSPAFAMLTWAIIGGSSTLPWNGGVDYKTFIIPVIAFTIPYFLDNMAQGIQRKDFQNMLTSWAQEFSKINESLNHFTKMLLEEIKKCSEAKNFNDFCIYRTNLEKYIQNLSKNLDRVSHYSQSAFQEMKQRTKAYFADYMQKQQDGWITVMTVQQYERHKKQNEDI